MAMSDGDLRMLGAVDGYAHAIVRLRQEIGSINHHGINPRHTRKLAAREVRLKSLRSIESWLVERHRETNEAYRKTRVDKCSSSVTNAAQNTMTPIA